MPKKETVIFLIESHMSAIHFCWPDSGTVISWSFKMRIWLLHAPGNYVSFNLHLPIWASKVKKLWKTLARMTSLLAPKRTCFLFFYWKSYVRNTLLSFSWPDSGNCYFLVFQNACTNLTFNCPGQSGKCLCTHPGPSYYVITQVLEWQNLVLSITKCLL